MGAGSPPSCMILFLYRGKISVEIYFHEPWKVGKSLKCLFCQEIYVCLDTVEQSTPEQMQACGNGQLYVMHAADCFFLQNYAQVEKMPCAKLLRI